MERTIWPDRLRDNLSEIYQERLRQEELKKSGKFLWTCADLVFGKKSTVISLARKLAVLSEEFG